MYILWKDFTTLNKVFKNLGCPNIKGNYNGKCLNKNLNANKNHHEKKLMAISV